MLRFSLRKKKTWMILGLVALLLRFILGLMPNVTEAIYCNGLFVAIRYTFDYTIGFLPFPFSLLLLIGLLFFGIRRWVRHHKKVELISRMGRFTRFLKSVGAFFGGVVFFFMFLWGFNYARLPLEEKIGLDVAPLTWAELKVEADAVVDFAMEARNRIPGITDSAVTAEFMPDDLENRVRADLEKALKSIGYGAYGEVRCRRVQPKGFMRGIGIVGIYNPFSGEGNVDAAHDPLSLPFTIAHEMAHGYGFTDEGTCNFLAFLACSISEAPVLNYAAWAVTLRYIRSDMRDLDHAYYENFLENMPIGIQADRRQSIAFHNEYPMWFASFSESINDFYLKAQGVEDGTKSYDRLVSMVVAFKNDMMQSSGAYPHVFPTQ
jgi:hypothetical protein